jgi:peptide deformylase
MFQAPPDDESEEAEEAEETEEASEAPLTILINPEIEALSEELEQGWEGCLSVPGLRGLVPRYSAIRYRGLAPDGSLIERQATGYHARVVQHECDHLDGVLYPMRMPDLSHLVFESEWHHVMAAGRAAEQDAAGQSSDDGIDEG